MLILVCFGRLNDRRKKMKGIITVKNNGHSLNTLIVNRPSWENMKKYYPADGVDRYAFFPTISKALGLDADAPAYENTCALRMSYALNHSGVKLGKAPGQGGMVIGDDKLNYWLRVKDLKNQLAILFGNADFSLKYPNKMPPATKSDITGSETYSVNHWNAFYQRKLFAENNFVSRIKDKTGIIAFEVDGWGNATGHFTLWDKGNLLYVGSNKNENDPTSAAYYVWHVEPRYDGLKDQMYLIQTTSIAFWELK